jgi:type VI secretion system secreted protein Hcp
MAVICAFLYLDGVKGEAQDANYEDHIELQSFSWGASNNSSYSEGTGPGIGTGQIHNMSFSKFMCKASTELMKRVIKGLPISSGAVKLCKRNGDDVQEYYTCNLEDVVVTQYNFHAGNNGELATESF